jgi:hypothetical protein
MPEAAFDLDTPADLAQIGVGLKSGSDSRSKKEYESDPA